MEQKIGREVIRGLLAKYWQAETTVGEEKILAGYFGGAEVAPEWEELRPLFAFFAEEAQVGPREGFQSRILERVGLTEDGLLGSGISEGKGAGDGGLGLTGGAMPAGRLVDMRVCPLRFAVAAAVIFCLGVSLFLGVLSPRTGPGSRVAGAVGSGRMGENEIAGTVGSGREGEKNGVAGIGDPGRGDNGKAGVVGSLGTGEITDTYSDPKQALAAIRRALLFASVNMNRGKSITQKNMNRLTNSWQAATGNGGLSQ